METITIEVEKAVKENKEISLPHYRKTSTSAFKVYSEKKCLWVTHGEYCDPAIQCASIALAWNNPEGEECTEAEFLEIYNQTIDRINSLANEVTA